MKVMAVNSSARVGGESKTEWVLNHLVEGMVSAGAKVDVVNLRDKKIKYCSGCFSCWTKSPGKCILQDDMTKELFPQWLASDLVVYATPLFHYTVNAQMKTFIERTLPFVLPFLEKREDRTSHPVRQEPPKAVVLSVAGFPEGRVFDQLSNYIRFLYGKGLLAEIYRPSSESLLQPGMEEAQASIAEALHDAGQELVRLSTVRPRTMHAIRQPLLNDIDQFHERGNMFWKTCIAEGVTPRQFRERGMVPRPDSIKTFMILNKMAFNSEGANNLKAIMQYRFSGAVQGDCYFSIENGKMAAVEGTCPNPTLTIDTPFDLWMDIMTGKADGSEMFMQQKYSVDGDLELLMKMGELFAR